MGVGPPDVENGIVNSIVSLVGHVVLYIAHIILQVILLILGIITVMNPFLLRITSFDIILAILAIVDILIARGL